MTTYLTSEESEECLKFIRRLTEEYSETSESPLRPRGYCVSRDEIDGEFYDCIDNFLEKK